MNFLLIGYGSTIHADDGFGPALADELRESNELLQVEILSGTQIVPEWAEAVSRARGVIFVDATANLSPGEIECSTLRDAPGETSLTHYFSPSMLLQLAKLLYGKAPQACLYTVGAAKLSLDESLSPETEQALPAVLRMVRQKLLSWQKMETRCELAELQTKG